MIESQLDEETTLLPISREESKGWSLKSKLGVVALTATALLSGVLFAGRRQSAVVGELSVTPSSKHVLIAQRKGYEKTSDHTLGIFGFTHLVEPDTETILTVTTCPDCTGLKWNVNALNERGSVTYSRMESGNTLKAIFSGASTTFEVKVEQNGIIILDEVVNCKYVRRELRTINDADLKRFFKAMQVMYSTNQEDGVALYGNNYISAAHLTANHDSKEYVYHGNLYFVTSHPAMQNRFEKSLLAIDPGVVLNYWDFLLDNQLGTSWADSPIYGDDMFGPVHTSPENDYRPSGYFHDVQLVYDKDEIEFPRSFHNPHGFLGSEEMTTSNKYLTRSDEYCGFKSVEGQVSCTNLVECFDTFETEHNLREFDICLEEKVHANLHMMHAGQWDCAVSWGDFYAAHGTWVDEMFLSILAVSMSTTTLAYKANGYVSCPTSCEFGESCSCSSSYSKITTADDVDTLTRAERFELAQDTWSQLATKSVNALTYVQFFKAYDVDGTVYNNVFLPINIKGDNTNGAAMDNDKIDLLNTLVLKTVLFQGQFGVMMSGAAPSDPLFWVMHPLFDKAIQALRMSPKYNTEGFTWNNIKGEMKWNGMTAFTRLDFEPYLGSSEDSKYKYLKNSELWEMLDPTKDTTYYVYDQYTSWGSCDFDPFGMSDDTADDESS